MEEADLKFSWKIMNFSKIETKIYSDVFPIGPFNWKVRADPNVNNGVNDLSLYLEVANSEALPSNWSQQVKFSITVVNQIDKTLSKTLSSKDTFDSKNNWGWSSFLSHKELSDPENGYLVDDTCIIKTHVTIAVDEDSRKNYPIEDLEGGDLKFSWKIKNFSKFDAKIHSNVFPLGPYNWRTFAYPKGTNCVDHLSLFLEVANSETLPSNWTQNVNFSLTVVNQVDDKLSKTMSEVRELGSEVKNRGWPRFLAHKELFDPKNGYLVNDTCIIKTHLTIISKDLTKEDMDAFFIGLNSVKFPQKVVSSEEEAKEALEILKEASGMLPADLNSSGRISQLKYAFDVLSLLDDCSILTSERKTELLSVKDNFIYLPELASKAVENIKLFNEKVLIKTTLDRKLKRCLVDFQKAKAGIAQNEDETEKKNLSLKQKEMFELSKELKTELDVLVKDWPEYEAKMKAAVEEEKVVNTEWKKMQQILSTEEPPDSSLEPHYLLEKEPN